MQCKNVSGREIESGAKEGGTHEGRQYTPLWVAVESLDDSPEGMRLYWNETNPQPWRNKRTRAKANRLLRQIGRGWFPAKGLTDVMQMMKDMEENRALESIYDAFARRVEFLGYKMSDRLMDIPPRDM